MARKGAPALYELLGRARGGKSPGGAAPFVPIKVQPRVPGTSGIGLKPSKASAMQPTTATAPTPGPADGGSSDGSASSAIRRGTSGMGHSRARFPLPSWGVIGAAFAIVSLILVYQLGVARGSDHRSDADQAAADGAMAPSIRAAAPSSIELAPGSGRRDPASGPDAGKPAQPAGPAPASENRAVPSGGSPTPSASEEGQPLGPMPKGIDPRQSGLNYFVVASVLEANADKMVQFCRDRGLDAWVVPDHNGRLREITVLPGVPKSELDGARAKALKARILKVGLQWKAAGRGNADFSGCYPKLYNG